jgi:predicted Zn-dependent protease with MMP-like domain
MGQTRKRKRIHAITGMSNQVRLLAEGLNLAQMGFLNVARDIRQLRKLVHEVAQRAGMTKEEIHRIESVTEKESA